jgi:hypothetical protein
MPVELIRPPPDISLKLPRGELHAHMTKWYISVTVTLAYSQPVALGGEEVPCGDTDPGTAMSSPSPAQNQIPFFNT